MRNLNKLNKINSRNQPCNMPSGFTLRKWYFDCIDKKGNLIIAYVGKLNWHAVKLHFSSLLLKNRNAETISSLKVTQLPEFYGDKLNYSNHLFNIELNKKSEPIKETLLNNESGKIEWNCHYPDCFIEIESKKLSIKGRGYAEELIMTIPPWELKIKELRWGRFVSNNNYVVWIEWKGTWPRFYAWYNGKRYMDGIISEEKIEFEKYKIIFSEKFVLRSGSLLTTVFKKFPALKRLFPFKALITEEKKWQSKGSLFLNNDKIEEGWCIYEKVQWL